LQHSHPFLLHTFVWRILATCVLFSQVVFVAQGGMKSSSFAPAMSLPVAESIQQNSKTVTSSPVTNQPIIFVHGLFQDARMMGVPQKNPANNAFVPLYAALEKYYESVQTFWYLDDMGYADGVDKNASCPKQYASCLSQSPVTNNAVKLDQMISDLYASSHHKVTLIGYSMGAAIIRTALSGCPQTMTCQANLNQKIAGLVNNVFFIAGVQQGSWIAQKVTNAETIIDAGITLLAPYQAALEEKWGLTKAAAADLAPQSAGVVLHNSSEPPDDIHYFNFYGNIQLTEENCLLVYCVTGKSEPIGDGILMPGDDNPKATPLDGGARFCLQCNGTNFSQIDADTTYTEWPLTEQVAIDQTGLDNCTDLGCVLAELSPLYDASEFHTNIPSDDSLNGTAIQVRDTTGLSSTPTTSIANEIVLQLLSEQNIYVDSSNAMYSLNASTGKQNWQYSLGQGGSSQIQVVNGMAYFITNDNVNQKTYLNVLDAQSGTLLHQYNLPFQFAESSAYTPSFTIVQGVIYLTYWNMVVAVNISDGTQIWQCQCSTRGVSAPVVVNNVVYFAAETGDFSALDSRTGKVLWHVNTGDTPPGSIMDSDPTPVIMNNLMYEISPFTDNVYAVNIADGSVRWHMHLNNEQTSTLLTNGENIYVGTFNLSTYTGSLYALSSGNGSILWQETNIGSMLFADNIAVYVFNNNIHALEALQVNNGSMLWQTQVAAAIVTSVYGILYVSSISNAVTLYALSESTGSSFWSAPIYSYSITGD
jgi:outer membrane protein assembly factor BamB/pimeloyl-ACP methyl ester carboxylesterase